MKSTFTLFTCFILMAYAGTAQVGVGTTSPHISAQLQVGAASGNTKGFLPPRVALTGTGDGSTIATPATGLMVYNTATAGTSPSNVTPGIYYYDGSKWQRVINQQPDATVDFSVNANPNTGGTTFTGTAVSKDVIYVSTIDNSQWVYNGTAYVTYTPPASTAWYSSGGTTDAGSNKTGSVYRPGKVGIGGSNTPNATLDIRTNPTSTTDPGAGFLGIGTTSVLANAAGAGAIRYSMDNGGVLQYSSGGTVWNNIQSNVQKVVVTGHFSSETYNNGSTTATSATLICNETSDNSNRFSSNTFTAPRTGLYLVTANLLSQQKTWIMQEELDLVFSVQGNAKVISAFFSPLNGSAFGSSNLSAVISMTQNETGTFSVITYQSGMRVAASIYNQFSITEL